MFQLFLQVAVCWWCDWKPAIQGQIRWSRRCCHLLEAHSSHCPGSGFGLLRRTCCSRLGGTVEAMTEWGECKQTFMNLKTGWCCWTWQAHMQMLSTLSGGSAAHVLSCVLSDWGPGCRRSLDPFVRLLNLLVCEMAHAALAEDEDAYKVGLVGLPLDLACFVKQVVMEWEKNYRVSSPWKQGMINWSKTMKHHENHKTVGHRDWNNDQQLRNKCCSLSTSPDNLWKLIQCRVWRYGPWSQLRFVFRLWWPFDKKAATMEVLWPQHFSHWLILYRSRKNNPMNR